jgi:hypothetical protein
VVSPAFAKKIEPNQPDSAPSDATAHPQKAGISCAFFLFKQ